MDETANIKYRDQVAIYVSESETPFSLTIQPKHSNLHIWNFMNHSNQKRLARPYVVFKTWDTNDRGVDVKQIFKIGKITAWNDKERITILLYTVSRSQ